MPCLQLRAKRDNEITKNSLAIHIFQDLKVGLKALNSDKLASLTLHSPNNTHRFQLKCPTGNGWRDTLSARTPKKTDAYNLRKSSRKETAANQNVLLFSL